NTAEDLAGLKIRSPGGAIAADFFKALGAEAGMVPFSGMYNALKVRTFDGQSDPLQVVLSLKLYEVQTYLSLTAHWWSGFTLLANAAAWNTLPRAVQGVVEQNAEKFALRQREDVEQINATGSEELARRGMRVNTADTQPCRSREPPGTTRRFLRAVAGEGRPGVVAIIGILCGRNCMNGHVYALDRHFGRSPRLRPLAGPRTGSAESRNPGPLRSARLLL